MNRAFIGGVSVGKRLFLSLFLFVPLLLACAESLSLKEFKPLRIINHVPFHPQEEFQCGPASLAGVLNFWGIQASPEEIAKDIYSPSARGTLSLDMILYPIRKGMEATHYQGSLEDIREKVDSGYPLIVLVDLGVLVYQQHHFMVVVGYDEHRIVANSGKNQHQAIPFKRFIKTWDKTNFWTLWIRPQ